MDPADNTRKIITPDIIHELTNLSSLHIYRSRKIDKMINYLVK